MRKRLLIAAVAAALLAFGAWFAFPQAPPNIVMIMADDLDVATLEKALALGWMPNLQQHIVGAGTTFSKSYVATSLCCPSRATFLTGQYPHNHHVLTNFDPEGGVTLLNDASTLATWLQAAGYYTGHIGKYLNGYGMDRTPSPKDDPTYIPPGWSSWQALVDGSTYRVYNYTINNNGTLVTYGTADADYQTDVLAARAEAFVQTAPTPFFLAVTPLAPHAETAVPGLSCAINTGNLGWIRPARRHFFTANGASLPKPPSYNEADVSDKPGWVQAVPAITATHEECLTKVYRRRLESIRAVDDLIGKIATALQARGLLTESVLIFTSDNGFLLGQHRLSTKTWVYEDSVRVPLYIRAPGFSAQTVSLVALNTDLAPTIAALAGVTPTIPVDGRSLLPAMANPVINWRFRFLVEQHREAGSTYPEYAALWSLAEVYAEYADGSREKYLMASDPDQMASVAVPPGSSDPTLAAFLTCAGDSCRMLEGP